MEREKAEFRTRSLHGKKVCVFLFLNCLHPPDQLLPQEGGGGREEENWRKGRSERREGSEEEKQRGRRREGKEERKESRERGRSSSRRRRTAVARKREIFHFLPIFKCTFCPHGGQKQCIKVDSSLHFTWLQFCFGFLQLFLGKTKSMWGLAGLDCSFGGLPM